MQKRPTEDDALILIQHGGQQVDEHVHEHTCPCQDDARRADREPRHIPRTVGGRV